MRLLYEAYLFKRKRESKGKVKGWFIWKQMVVSMFQVNMGISSYHRAGERRNETSHRERLVQCSQRNSSSSCRVSTRPWDHNLTSLAFSVISCWAENPLIPNRLTREVGTPDPACCIWPEWGPSASSATLLRKPSSSLAWLLGRLPTWSLSFHLIPSRA